MGRGKLSMNLVECEKDRKKYRTRIQGLKKKAMQFSSLWGVDTSIISFGPSSSDALEVWLENDQSWQVGRIVQRYLDLQPKERNVHRKLDLPAILDNLKTKPDDQGQQRPRCQPSLSDRLNSFSEEGLKNLARILEVKVEVAKRRLEGLDKGFEQGPVHKRGKIQVSDQEN